MIQITMFAGFKKCMGNASLLTVLENIRIGVYGLPVGRIRQAVREGRKEEAADQKKQLPGFTVSATYSGPRKTEHITAYQPLVILDFDHLSEEEIGRILPLLREAVYTVSCFISPSGTGIKVIACSAVDVERCVKNHPVIYHTLQTWYTRLTGVELDTSGKDPGRLCFVSSDPQLYLSSLYAAWLEGDGGELPDGVPLLPPVSPKAAAGKVSLPVSSLFAKAVKYTGRKEAFTDGNRNNYIYRFACHCNRLGIPRTEALSFCVTHYPGLPDAEYPAAIESAYTHVAEHGKQDSPVRRPQGCPVERVEAYLKERYRLRRNVVRSIVEFRRRGSKAAYQPVTDYWENSLWRDLQKQSVCCRLSDLRAIIHSDFSPEYNPFESYFKELPPWDGRTDYIGALAATVRTTHDAYWSLCLRKWLVASVACALEAGKENHSVLLLSGEQGLGKTTWLRHLVPPELAGYVYSGNLDPSSKDSSLLMSDCFLIILDELSGQSRMELNKFKAMITQDTVHERRAYAHNAETYVRRASFAATVNDSQVLTDRTGSRRFLCFEAQTIDYTTPVNHTGIYSEALALYQSGLKYWFSENDISEINDNNEPFQLSSPEEELFYTYFRKPERFDVPFYLSSSDIVAKIAEKTRLTITSINVNNLGKMLKRDGFEQKRAAHSRLFLVVELSFEQIKANFLRGGEINKVKTECIENEPVGLE